MSGPHRTKGWRHRVIDWIHQRRSDRRRREEAVRVALGLFQRHHDQLPHGPMTRVVHSDPDVVVVRVCYGPTRPPRRYWVAVPTEGEASELTWEQA